ncbi:chemotaxis protein CheW [Marinobacter sp. MDS2]|uniref:chemotaxis protein CheW n=1 Tax=Marinobacter sp. MDS2 TaxID=3065961 RepID=UPI00273C8A92|nr:chemotaxis protein CheW [Marinobacter sp. MDS2]MDP4546710.1 chemotaxis protein CheW [Marinobacter sp. MDS2]
MADKKMTQLTASDAAIASYLDELLHTATETAEQEERVVPDPQTVEPEPVPVEPPVVEETVPHSNEPAARPDWSEKPFECLIFTVAGLQLAVPLVLLGAIHKIEEEIRSLPGSPDWYMGIRPGNDYNLRVVDSAQWIMAGRVPDNARDNYRFIIRLDDSPWGLACDSVGQSFTLDPEQVRWRTARSQRPWLAGTVIDHMCALIDVRAMSELLVRAEREQRLDLS